jgi:hypothetical protein
MEWTFTGEVIEWRGPTPYLFVAMTPGESEDLKEGFGRVARSHGVPGAQQT